MDDPIPADATPTPSSSTPTLETLSTEQSPMAGDDLEEKWRDTILRQLENLTKLQNTTALLVERLDGRMSAAENSIKEIKASPNAIRGNLGVILQAGGCLGSIVFALFSLASIILSIIVFVTRP